jgi:hypothetical protein
MNIDDGGNVGINTTSPTSLFHVFGGMVSVESNSTGASNINSGAYAMMLGPQHTRTTAANTYYGGIAFNHLLNYSGGTGYNGAPGAWVGIKLYDTPGSERDYLVFATKSGTGTSGTGTDVPTDRMVIDPFGNVGIGITTPGYTLTVQGSSKVLNNYFYVDYNQNGGSGPAFQSNAGSLAVSGNWTAGEAEVDFWNTSPNVGSNRGFKFWAGTSASGYTEVVRMNQNGNLNASSYSNFSDGRLKSDLLPLGANTAAAIYGVKTYSYKYDKSKMEAQNLAADDYTHYGVVAQELEAIFPNIVYTDAKGIKSVNYNELVPLLIEVVKEQNKRIAALENQR